MRATEKMHTEKEKPSRIVPPNIQEIGAPIDGEPQVSNRRLFFQLHVFSRFTPSGFFRIRDRISPIYGDRKYYRIVDEDSISVTDSAKEKDEFTDLDMVLYEDLNHPRGSGVLFIAEEPTTLITEGRNALKHLDGYYDFKILASYRPEMTMIGRTYATGREPDLEEWLINKPLRNALNPEFPWAIWYPLRRKSEFYRLEPRERGRILAEHAMLGRSYAAGGYASDIRLACFGLDTNDNEFVIGLVGAELHPLSRLIQEMRQTEQTTKYIESLGPFFVGKVSERLRIQIRDR